MKVGTTSTTKFNRLVRNTGLPTFAVVGLLESIWHITAREAPRGDIGRLDDVDIASNIGWGDDASELIEHLVDARWLVRCDEFRLVVNDWHEHCPNYIKANLKRQGIKFASLSISKSNTQLPTKTPTKLITEKPTKNPSENTTTKPNQSNSIQEITAASAGDAQTKGESESLSPPPTDLEHEPRWQTVIEQLRQRGIQHAAPAAFAARDAGCTIAEITAVVNYFDFRKCYDAAQLCHRIKHSHPGQSADDGWPVRNAPTETRSREAKIEQEAHALENRIVKAGRKKEVPDEAIRDRIRKQFAAQGFPLKYSTWCSEAVDA